MNGLTIPVNMFNVEPMQDLLKLIKNASEDIRIPQIVRDELQAQICTILVKAEQNADSKYPK